MRINTCSITAEKSQSILKYFLPLWECQSLLEVICNWIVNQTNNCVGITTDFQNFHMCGKNQTCVGIDNDHLNYHVCGFYHTCVDFTKYLRHVKVFGKNHTCVGRYKHVCVFQNTGWFILYLLLYLTKSFEILNLQHISLTSDPGSRYF